jgi:hypothetical protein
MINYFIGFILLVSISYLVFKRHSEFTRRKKIVLGKNKYNVQKYKYK